MTNFEILQGLVEHVMQDTFLISNVNAVIVDYRDTVKFSYYCSEGCYGGEPQYDNHVMRVHISEDQQTVSVSVWYVDPDRIHFLIYNIDLLIGSDKSRGVVNFDERQASYPRRFGGDIDCGLLYHGIYPYFKVDKHNVEDKSYTMIDTMEDAKQYQEQLKNPQPSFEEFIKESLRESIEDCSENWDDEDENNA